MQHYSAYMPHTDEYVIFRDNGRMDNYAFVQGVQNDDFM